VCVCVCECEFEREREIETERRNWAELLGRGVLVFLDCVLAPSPISLPLLLSSLRESGFLGAPVWLHELEELPSGADLFWVGFFS